MLDSFAWESACQDCSMPTIGKCSVSQIKSSFWHNAMGIFSRWFGRKQDIESHEVPSMPWDQGPSILEFMRSHIPSDTPGLAQDGYKLPDEERINAGAKIRWAAGV